MADDVKHSTRIVEVPIVIDHSHFDRIGHLYLEIPEELYQQASKGIFSCAYRSDGQGNSEEILYLNLDSQIETKSVYVKSKMKSIKPTQEDKEAKKRLKDETNYS